MRVLILVLAVMILATGCGGFLSDRLASGLRPEQTLDYYIDVYGEPDSWFRTTERRTRYLSVAWNCTPQYVHVWFRHIKDDEDRAFGAVWMVERVDTAAGICR